MPILTITTPANGPQRYEISPNRETVSLGRSSKSDIKISCESVSGQHATLRKLPDGYVLRDLGSTNGTKLDGIKESEIHLKSGMKIHLGDVAFDFVPDGATSKADERAKTSKADGKSEASHEPEPEHNPLVLGLSLMGAGLIVLGCVVLLGIDAIKAIAERSQASIVSGGVLILAGIFTLASILFATGRVKVPKLVLRFDGEDDEDDDEDTPRRKKRKKKDEDDDEEKEDGEGDDDSDEDEDDDDEVGKPPKEEDDEEESEKKDS